MSNNYVGLSQSNDLAKRYIYIRNGIWQLLPVPFHMPPRMLFLDTSVFRSRRGRIDESLNQSDTWRSNKANV